MFVYSHINVGENQAGILLCSEEQLSPSSDKSPFPVCWLRLQMEPGMNSLSFTPCQSKGERTVTGQLSGVPCLKITRKGQGWNLARVVQPRARVSCSGTVCSSLLCISIPLCQMLCSPVPSNPSQKAFKLNLTEYLGQISEVLPAAADSGSP